MSDNAYDRHSYAGAAPDTTLASSISDTDLTVTCADLTGWPDGTGGNFVVIFEPGKTAEEKCLASSRSGNVLTLVSRGMEGSAAAHTATTTTVRHGYSARDANEANYAVSQTVGKISAKGSIVVGSAANTLVELPIGSTGQALVVSGGTLAYGKPTLAESDVTGLVNDLAAKLATPSTAIAKGSILAGTGANVADSVAVGSDGLVLTADSTASAGVSWQSSPSAILGSTAYVSSVSSLPDTTHLTLTFTAPASGKVLLRTVITVNSNNFAQTIVLGWRAHNTSTTVGADKTVWTTTGSSGVTVTTHTAVSEQIITGLTAGTSYTYDLYGSGGTTYQDAVLTAWGA